MVVSYRPILHEPARVFINGIYDDLGTAKTRQMTICDGIHNTNYFGTNTVKGNNGLVSWIKHIPNGDVHNVNIYDPDV
jgi:hypothetical protein